MRLAIQEGTHSDKSYQIKSIELHPLLNIDGLSSLRKYGELLYNHICTFRDA